MKILSCKKIYSILVLGAIFLPGLSLASSVYIDTGHSEFFVGDTILFSVYVDSESKNINAVEGEVLLDHAAGAVSLADINTAGSKFSLWPGKPLPSERNTRISFTGGSPGGLISKDAIVFNIVLKLKETGQVALSPNNIEVYVNDGKGTKDEVSIKDLIIDVLPKKSDAQSADDWSTIISNDKTPPESFEITHGKDPSVFDNQYFISFFTTDAESGIAYYEVQEGERDFVRAESPYLLQDQSLKNLIKVKAIDKAGNERIEEFKPTVPEVIPPTKFYKTIIFWLIIALVLIAIGTFFKFKRSLLFCILIFSFCIFNVAHAATSYFNPSSGNFTVGNIFTINVLVNTEGIAINNAEATINFPTNFLEIVSLSKSGSIFSLWVEEPTFSNSVGTLSFNGGLPTPGFNGTAGKLLNIVFRAKKEGSASLIFSSAAVRANDGFGTDVLQTKSQAQFNLISEEKVVQPLPPAVGIPGAPEIVSTTHPDSDKWYSNNAPEFSWDVPDDVTAVKLLIGRLPIATPTVLYTPPISEKKIEEEMPDGEYYFHARFKNKYGWGAIAHRKVLIDTQPPEPFKIEVKEGKETTNPQSTLYFETIDEMSGIDHYEIKIDEGDMFPIKIEDIKHNPFKMPVQAPGRHAIIVKAVDKAGNETLAMTEIEILAIEAPVITDYPRELLPGSILSIKGTALPEATVRVYIQKDKEEVKIGETKSDKEGKWVYIEVEPVEKGVYQIWAETIDASGAKSRSSEKVGVLISPPVFIRIGKLAIDYLTTIMTLLILILAIIFGVFWTWLKIKEKRRKMKKEISEAEKVLHKAFEALKTETEEQVTKLDGKPGLSEREKKICNDLKKALKISEGFIGKEIRDIGKEIEK